MLWHTSGSLALGEDAAGYRGAFSAPLIQMGAGRRIAWLEQLASTDEWIRSYRSVIEREVVRYARVGGDPDDLLAEALLAVVEARTTYDPKVHRTDRADYVQNHVHRKVRASYVAELRHRIRRADRDATEPSAADDQLLALEAWWDMMRAWDSLSARDRAALARRDDREGSSASGAARKKRLQRARHRLRRAMAAEAEMGTPGVVRLSDAHAGRNPDRVARRRGGPRRTG